MCYKVLIFNILNAAHVLLFAVYIPMKVNIVINHKTFK